MKVPKKLKDEIKLFCDLNKIKDIDKFILSAIQIGFNIEKYGNAPWKQEIEVEKIVEKEVIKEVIIEKEIFISDDKKVLELGEELNSLREGIRKKEQEIISNAHNMKSLNGEIESKKKEITNLSDKLEKVNKDLEKFQKEEPLPPPVDLYGDDKVGWWGSNLLKKK